MNETQKTGIFWGLAAVVTLLAAFVAWPRSVEEGNAGGPDIGVPLFDFKDPLVAASLKIVTFNESQGELKNFEVRKDAESGLWTIPSKGSYPADAVEQMRDAANALVDLKILDVPTDNPEDHLGMGVVEPKLEDLNPGDEGVGRLVTFKDKSQKVLASVIIGGPVKGQEGQLYVRKPGQDPVYVVKLDDTPLSTKFDEWIEEDLLQLSSIDVEDVEIKDYNASLGLQGVSLTRNHVVSLVKDGATWTLDALKEYDKTNPLAEPTPVSIDSNKKLNTQKLNDLANALDDLKFVDVKRKPDGISANLKADKDFASDQEAANQLAGRGFIPVPLGPNREIEILSANGELTATTKDGVKYILRFGNISGISEGEKSEGDDAAEGESTGGVNRYLMVSTVVDESKFPVPELKEIPKTLEDLDALDKPAPPEGVDLPPELNAPEGETVDGDSEMKEAESTEEAGDSESESEAVSESAESDSTENDPAEEGDKEAETASEESDSEETGETESGETEASGEGESTTVGEGQEPDDEDVQADESSDEASAETEGSDEAEASTEAEPDSGEAAASEEMTEEVGDSDEEPEETLEEKEERLAAVQEKITKENTRLLDARKEQLEKARLQSKALNERFADWYYVIPEATYAKLRISRDDLFESADAAAQNPGGLPPGMPPGMQNMRFPGGQFPGAPGN